MSEREVIHWSRHMDTEEFKPGAEGGHAHAEDIARWIYKAMRRIPEENRAPLGYPIRVVIHPDVFKVLIKDQARNARTSPLTFDMLTETVNGVPFKVGTPKYSSSLLLDGGEIVLAQIQWLDGAFLHMKNVTLPRDPR